MEVFFLRRSSPSSPAGRRAAGRAAPAAARCTSRLPSHGGASSSSPPSAASSASSAPTDAEIFPPPLGLVSRYRLVRDCLPARTLPLHFCCFYSELLRMRASTKVANMQMSDHISVPDVRPSLSCVRSHVVSPSVPSLPPQAAVCVLDGSWGTTTTKKQEITVIKI